MEHPHHAPEMLALLTGPAFAAENGTVTWVNQQAIHYGITLGESVKDYLAGDYDEYSPPENGILYLDLLLDGCVIGAEVSRASGLDVYLLTPAQSQPELQAIALAAQHLREPLSGILIAADKLLPLAQQQDPSVQRQTALFSRSLHQVLRLVGNMSDAARYAAQTMPRKDLRNITAVVGEIFEKAATLVLQAGITLRFENLPEPVLTAIDSEKLERAIYNLLSNAIKFTQPGGEVSASLTRRGSRLLLCVRDSGSGISDEVYGSVFTRHLRQLGLEDCRYGIGLGMVLVRSAATAHGGTVLVQRLPEGGTCVTMTLSVTRDVGSTLTSPILLPDYTGGFDHGLIELSDVLPPEAYR